VPCPYRWHIYEETRNENPSGRDGRWPRALSRAGLHPRLGGTGFPACASPRCWPARRFHRRDGEDCRRAVSARVGRRRARQCRAPTGGTSMRKPGMAARRDVWALARFLHRKQLPGEKEKNALAGCPLRPLVTKLRPMPSALRSLGKAFFPFSPALGTHGAQKRAKAHIPGLLQDRPRVSFVVSGFPACVGEGDGRPFRDEGKDSRSRLRSSVVSRSGLRWSS